MLASARFVLLVLVLFPLSSVGGSSCVGRWARASLWRLSPVWALRRLRWFVWWRSVVPWLWAFAPWAVLFWALGFWLAWLVFGQPTSTL